MSGKKALFLFLALLLPVCIFLFLKIFGKNEFNVPALHQKEVIAPTGCNLEYTAPYVLADSTMEIIRRKGEAQFYLLNFSGDDGVPGLIKSEVSDPALSVQDGLRLGPDPDFLGKCIFLIAAPSDLVLLDNDGRIRGYYEGGDLDERDRLVVELKILLKQY